MDITRISSPLKADTTMNTATRNTARTGIAVTHRRRLFAVAAAAMAAGLLISGCGGGAAAPGTGQTAAADPASAKNASGNLTICGGKDASGIYKGTAEAFTNATPGITAKYTEIGATTDQARTQAVQRLEGKSTECDLFLLDVIWTSEFASQAGFLTRPSWWRPTRTA